MKQMPRKRKWRHISQQIYCFCTSSWTKRDLLCDVERKEGFMLMFKGRLKVVLCNLKHVPHSLGGLVWHTLLGLTLKIFHSIGLRCYQEFAFSQVPKWCWYFGPSTTLWEPLLSSIVGSRWSLFINSFESWQ